MRLSDSSENVNTSSLTHDADKGSGHRWVSFGLVLAIVMMLTAAIMATVVSLIAYSKSYENSDTSNNQGAQIQILLSTAKENREHINRLYREIDRLKDEVALRHGRRR